MSCSHLADHPSNNPQMLPTIGALSEHRQPSYGDYIGGMLAVALLLVERTRSLTSKNTSQ